MTGHFSVKLADGRSFTLMFGSGMIEPSLTSVTEDAFMVNDKLFKLNQVQVIREGDVTKLIFEKSDNLTNFCEVEFKHERVRGLW
jgi:hypothetical protein